MSFLIDPPLLYANGQAYARLAPSPERPDTTRALGAATIAVFWLVGISMYLNLRWTLPFARAFGSENGRDFMLNSGVLRFDHRGGAGTHVIAGLVFLTYPLWLALGYRAGLRTRDAQG